MDREMQNVEMLNAEMPNAENQNADGQIPPPMQMEIPEMPMEQKQHAELKLKSIMVSLRKTLEFWGFTSKQRVNYAVAKFLNGLSLEVVNERVNYEITLRMPYKYKNYLLANEYLLNGKYKAIKPCELTDEEFDDYKTRLSHLLHTFIYEEGGSEIFGVEGAEIFKRNSVSDEERGEDPSGAEDADDEDEIGEGILEEVDEDIQILRVIRLITHHRLPGNHRQRPRMPPHGGLGFVPFWHMMAWRLANNPLTDDVVTDQRFLFRNDLNVGNGSAHDQAVPNGRRGEAPAQEENHIGLELPIEEIRRIADRNTDAIRAREAAVAAAAAAAAAANPEVNVDMEVNDEDPLLNDALAIQRLNLVDNVMVGGESSTDNSDVEDVFVVSSDTDMEESERNEDTSDDEEH